MMSAISSLNSVNVNFQPLKKQETDKTVKQDNKSIQTSNNDQGASRAYVLGGVSFGGKGKKTDDIKQWINALPFADDLTPEDKIGIRTVMARKDEETEYMKKMIHLICKKEVTPFAVTSLCKNGKMSDLAKADIDIYYDKVKSQGMSIEDAFVPKHASQVDGQNATKIGDVFRVDGQDKIFVKTDDEDSMMLDMDSETYLKLYPPVERFASSQGGTGDCYLLSSINSIMENERARASLYSCFHQTDDGVSVKFPFGQVTMDYPGIKLPSSADLSKYTEGPTGMKLLENAYGFEFEAQKFTEYKDVMKDSFDDMKYQKMQLEEKTPSKKTQKKIAKLDAKIKRFEQNYKTVTEAMKDPNRKLTFVLDDEDNLIIGYNGPTFKDCDELDPEYKSPAEYYTGAIGGYMNTALYNLGFEAHDFIVGDAETEKELKDKLFCKDTDKFVITAATPAEEGEDMESPVAEQDSIYSAHAYKVEPYDDENGKRMFKVTNPWNQSHQVSMSYEKMISYFEIFTIAEADRLRENV